MKFSPFNFGGLEKQDFHRAKVVILPIPFEETTDYIKGTINGPEAIISASRELDEVYQKNLPIFTFDEIELEGETIKEKMEDLEKFILKILKQKKIPILIGGEHTISFGSITAFYKEYRDNFSVLHLDAHCDLLDEYKGSRLNYATVMRRIRELGTKVVSVGVRSIDEKTLQYVKQNKINIFTSSPISLGKILKHLKKNVYLSLDFDVLDPSIMPSVSNPVPGGLTFEDIIILIEKLGRTKKIIGADVVEFCPIPGLSFPEFLAAKIIYKILETILNQPP